MLPDETVFGPGPRSRPETQDFLGEWPCAVLPDEIHAGNIRGFLNFGGSLLTSFPDTRRLEPALRSLDLMVTTGIIANGTTVLSTHVLPTKDQLERVDVTLWDFLLPSVCAQHTPAVVSPIGDRRSAWWVLAEIGRQWPARAACSPKSPPPDLQNGSSNCRPPGWSTTSTVPGMATRPATPGRPIGRAPAEPFSGANTGARPAPATVEAERGDGLPRRARRGPPAFRRRGGRERAGRAAGCRSHRACCADGDREGRRTGATRCDLGAARPSPRQRQRAHRQGRHRSRHGDGALLRDPGHGRLPAQ